MLKLVRSETMTNERPCDNLVWLLLSHICKRRLQLSLIPPTNHLPTPSFFPSHFLFPLLSLSSLPLFFSLPLCLVSAACMCMNVGPFSYHTTLLNFFNNFIHVYNTFGLLITIASTLSYLFHIPTILTPYQSLSQAHEFWFCFKTYLV